MVESESGTIENFDYLHDTSSDPRRPLTEALVKSIGPEGSVVAYYKAFEEAVIKNLAERFPEFKTQLLDIASRLVDPLPIVRNNVYDADFHGSFSIKSVAPALLGEKRSYENLPVADGQAAGRAYLKLISVETSTEEKLTIKNQMLDYCRQDTAAMKELVAWLRGHSAAS